MSALETIDQVQTLPYIHRLYKALIGVPFPISGHRSVSLGWLKSGIRQDHATLKYSNSQGWPETFCCLEQRRRCHFLPVPHLERRLNFSSALITRHPLPKHV